MKFKVIIEYFLPGHIKKTKTIHNVPENETAGSVKRKFLERNKKAFNAVAVKSIQR